MRTLFLILVTALLTSGCGMMYRQSIYQGNLLDTSAVEQLQTGMDKHQVSTLLGTPSIRDPFHHDRWDYVATRRTGRTGPATVKTMTLWFENGSLSKWEGDYFPEEDSELAKTMGKYGNLAKDKKKRRR